MIQTTFKLLGADQPDTDSILISIIEGITGAWQLYGIDTPINILDVFDKAGRETAITCLYSSLTDNRELAKTIAVAVVQAHIYAYLNALPNDTRIFDLLYYCDLYLQNTGVSETPRIDYCGDPLSAVGIVSLAQILDVANHIQTTINALNLVGTLPTFTIMVHSNGPMSDALYRDSVGNDINSIDIANPVNDPANQDPVGTSGYTTTSISQLANNPNTFLNNTITYDPFSSVYYVARIQYQNPNIAIIDYANRAAFGIGNAAIMASQQITQNNGMLLNIICNTVKNAITDFDSVQRQIINPQLTYYQQLVRGIPAGHTGIDQWDADGKLVMDAGLRKRADLLRDQSFLSRFDSAGNGTLNSSDRVAAEKAINAAVLDARIAVALPLYNAVLATYSNFTTQSDQIDQIVRTYLL